MKLTNKHNLPEPVVKALTRNEYTRGASNRSITQLIDSPRIRILRQEHWDDMEEDVSEKLWAVLGTAAHKMFEDTAEGQFISEERVFLEVEGWTISGAIDVQHVEADGITIIDYKTCSVWSVIMGKPEWERQLNCYASLVRRSKNFPVKSLKVIAMMRDWKSSGRESDYPPSPIMVIDIPMWSEEEQDAYLNGRVHLHQQAEFDRLVGGNLVSCSSEEMWEKPAKYAIKKKGNKRALKLYESHGEAQEALQPGQLIEIRPGERTRCAANWCRVNAWCDQYQNYITEPVDE